MKIERISADGDHCNFCNRGKFSKSNSRLVFPYSHITSISSEDNSGISIRICDQCIKELVMKVDVQ